MASQPPTSAAGVARVVFKEIVPGDLRKFKSSLVPSLAPNLPPVLFHILEDRFEFVRIDAFFLKSAGLLRIEAVGREHVFHFLARVFFVDAVVDVIVELFPLADDGVGFGAALSLLVISAHDLAHIVFAVTRERVLEENVAGIAVLWRVGFTPTVGQGTLRVLIRVVRVLVSVVARVLALRAQLLLERARTIGAPERGLINERVHQRVRTCRV